MGMSIRPKKYNYYCAICGGAIRDGEEYIENADYEYAHMDCLQDVKDVLDWFDCRMKIMSDGEIEIEDY